MKIRAIGTGGAFCRHPLVTSSFLIQSENSNVIIGCGPGIPSKLETINLSMEQIDIWIPLHGRQDQAGGLEEVASLFLRMENKKKPFLVAPHVVIEEIRRSFRYFLPKLEDLFEVRASSKVTLNEEHFSETIVFIQNYLGFPESYGALFEESEIFISGDTHVVDEFIHQHGMPAKLILHSCYLEPGYQPYWRGASIKELQELPIYLQQKIWLYGYSNLYLEQEDPLPMLFLPQGTCLFDSDRKAKHLEKERFIKENSKRQIGNLTSAG